MATCNKKCEVYSRIVGYHRPVQNWNRGKKEEFKMRQVFSETVSLNSTNGTCQTLKVSREFH
jgi:ribonucleoside-triphosphate reductase (formate)